MAEAVEAGGRAAELAPRSAPAHIYFALALLDSGAAAEAEREARAARHLSPDNTSARAMHGLVLLSTDRFDEALAVLSSSLASAASPIAARCLLRCEELLAQTADPPPAEAIAPSIWGAPTPRSRGGWRLFLSRAELSGLTLAYSALYLPCPRARRAYLDLIDGDALSLAGCYDRALAKYDRALKYAPGQHRAAAGAALALLLTGAAQECRRRLRALPDEVAAEMPAVLLLGASEVILGRAERALPLLGAAAASSPAEFPALYYLGRALLATGQRHGAVQAFEGALDTLHPGVPTRRLLQLAAARGPAA